MKNRPSRLRNEDGFTLFSAFLLLILMLTLGSASMVYSTLDLRSTTHYDTGNQALYAAEAGIVHSLSTINTMGVQSFSSDITTRWSTVFGSTTRTVSGHTGVQYTVTATANAANPTDKGTLTAVGTAPMGATRTLKVNVQRSGVVGSPGALYLAANSVNSTFNGSSFDIDGNNYGINGALSGTLQVPGISTRNDAVTSGVSGSLSTNQKKKVKGLGYSASPPTPSVLTTGGPGVSDLDRIISQILSTPGVVTNNTKKFNGGDTFGSVAYPQITHLTNSVEFTGNGNSSGAGIMIVDGDVKINGTLNFTGWIIVSGSTVIDTQQDTGPDGETTWVTGTANVLGSLWTGDLDIRIGGNAVIDYCKACMELAGGINPNTNLVPQPMAVVSWEESLS